MCVRVRVGVPVCTHDVLYSTAYSVQYSSSESIYERVLTCHVLYASNSVQLVQLVPPLCSCALGEGSIPAHVLEPIPAHVIETAYCLGFYVLC